MTTGTGKGELNGEGNEQENVESSGQSKDLDQGDRDSGRNRVEIRIIRII